jgi:hypothetical protein
MKFYNLFFILFQAFILVSIEGFCPNSAVSITVKKASDHHFTKQQSLCLSKNLKQDEDGISSAISTSDQLALGIVGTKMGIIVLISEYVLKTSGCGLPAGPYGLIGAAEGISYLGVTVIAAFSLYTKLSTGSGLPAGPKGILGLAEGLSFLAIAVGLGVLGFQWMDYGYIPNFVPTEDGLCK